MTRIIRRIALVVAFAWVSSAAAVPITDTVTVDGTQWAQADLFINLAWSDINSVCPSGVCSCGALNGFDMEGWTWASTDDARNLFNHYIGFPALSPLVDRYSGDLDTFALAFFDDGWRPTVSFSDSMLARLSGDELDVAMIAQETTFSVPGIDIATTEAPEFASLPQFVGALFHRSSSPVPGPATLPLCGLALVVLGLSRGKLKAG